jgi:hypothetical protein
MWIGVIVMVGLVNAGIAGAPTTENTIGSTSNALKT